MKVIGMCGGSGSGKGVACSFFAELGIRIIDTDKVYHTITSSDTECMKELSSVFGTAIIENGKLNRKALADIVFSSRDRLKLLNSITHKHILSEVRRIINRYQKEGATGVIVDAPLLFESGFDKECDATLAICASTETRISRIIKRDNISKEMAIKRIQSQKRDEWLKMTCDYYIDNDSTTDNLKSEVYEIAKKIFDI